MKVSIGTSLAVMLWIYAGSAMAGSAVLNSDMTAFEGPDDNYRPVLHLVAGQRIDIIECNFKQWCQIEHEGTLGWVHASLGRPAGDGDGGAGNGPGVPGNSGSEGDTASGDGGTSGGGSTGGGSRTGGSRPTLTTTGGGITLVDKTSSNLAGRGGDSGSSGGSSGGSSPPGSESTEMATVNSHCRSC